MTQVSRDVICLGEALLVGLHGLYVFFHNVLMSSPESGSSVQCSNNTVGDGKLLQLTLGSSVAIGQSRREDVTLGALTLQQQQ